MTASGYLFEAIERIDKQLGEGYAEEHPELIVGFMHAAAFDCSIGVLAQQLRAAIDDIDISMDTQGIVEAITLHTEQLSGLTNATFDISNRLDTAPAP